MSFTRYNKVGRESQKRFERALQKDGFHHLHSNLYVRYCTTSSNANMHKERVKGFIPDSNSDISIIMSADNQEQNTYHCLNRKRTKSRSYKKPEMVEFF
ncbi:MAG: CRISPR-associated endonuclease Cas2 [Prevotella sp.]|nr:CRISPR-associated endonuclease Cas2 [Prevotella sp.]